ELADHLLALLAGVVRLGAPRLERAGVDPQVEQLTVGVGHDLEDQTAERLLGVGLALLLLVLFRMMADNGRAVERAGEVISHGVHERLDADVLAAGTAEDRLDGSLQGQRTEGSADCVGGDIAAFEVSASEEVLLVLFGEYVEELLAVALGLDLVRGGD